METKKRIREEVLRRRSLWTDQEVREKSRVITDRICLLPAFLRAERLLVYINFGHEVATRPLIEEAWRTGKEVAVPVCRGRRMDFIRFTDYRDLSPGAMQIPEPVRGEPVDWPEALMIMPGVAYDEELHRIGYGGGFYDRYLAGRPEVTRIGAAFSFQVFPSVPHDSHDISPQLLVTETGIRYRKQEEKKFVDFV